MLNGERVVISKTQYIVDYPSGLKETGQVWASLMFLLWKSDAH